MTHMVSDLNRDSIVEMAIGVARNEMAQEWKKNEHYVANNTTLGDNIPVEELDDDEPLSFHVACSM